ncbi:hypothetical protein QTL97_17860 [Sporosarcina thermotolerans]|uniref:Uncharacterized protein n=1 Tax=Sporosarcina thermotolerans TaxID=633404 RepID=A0AAW9ADX3_9BACL|nr:hypothetical protein [Sporosarcina thermotolerans]MDW0118793.1 hypothetical protein [Sporosarcina thermotolerans]WHT48479.1 hypothetical protein QNH10_01155 [Sporosarcina thermotolerans]
MKQGAHSNLYTNPKTPGNRQEVKEEISMELAELGNLKPKHEPMTQNDRQKSEKDKYY